MAKTVIDNSLQHARTIPHFHLGILEYRGSLRRQCQRDFIVHVAWHVTARHERCDSHRRSQHSTIVGLAHNTSCELHPSAIMKPLCLQYRGLELRHDVDAEYLCTRLLADDNHIASPREHDKRHGKSDWSPWCIDR